MHALHAKHTTITPFPIVTFDPLYAASLAVLSTYFFSVSMLSFFVVDLFEKTETPQFVVAEHGYYEIVLCQDFYLLYKRTPAYCSVCSVCASGFCVLVYVRFV